MAEENITTRFKVDISDLKAGITEANKQMKLANAEFKKASSGMDDWSKSSTGIAAKLKQLDSILASQKSKVQNYNEQLQRQKQAYAENGSRADQLRAKLKELADQGVSKTSEEYKKYQAELTKCEKEQLANQKAIDDLNITLLNQEAAVNKTEKEMADLTQELDKVETAEKEAAKTGKTVDDVLKDMEKSSKEAEGGFTILKGTLANLAADAIRSAINGIKEFAAETIEVGRNFDSSMSNVAALSGATGAELEKLRQTAKDFGSTTQFSASEAADALGYMALAGWDANQSADALGGVLNLAAASGMDLASAADMVTDYMSAFGMEAEQSAYFADLLAYAQANANTTAAGLGDAFKNVAANASAAGQDIETTTSFLAMMANQGLKGSEAGTALNAVMRDMTAKMKDGAIAIGDTNVQVMDSEGNYRDLTDILADVEAATEGMGDAEKAAALQSTFTSDSIKGLNLILNAGVGEAAKFEEELRNSSVTTEKLSKTLADSGVGADAFQNALKQAGLSTDEFDEILKSSGGTVDGLMVALSESGVRTDTFRKALKDSGISLDEFDKAMESTQGAAGEMAKVMNDNLGGDLTAFGSKLEGVQIAIYEKFEPALRKGVDVLSSLLDAVQWVVDHSDGFITAISAMAAGLAAYFAYTTAITVMKEGWMALTVVQKAVTAAQWLMNAAMSANPIGLVVAAVAALVVAFIVLWKRSEKFREFWLKLWDKVKKAVIPVIKALTKWFKETWDAIKKVWDKALPFFKDIWEGIKKVFSVVASVLGGFFKAAWTAIKNAWSSVVSWFTNIWNQIKAVFSVVAQVLGGFFSAAWTAIKNAWSSAVSWFSNIWSGIKNVFSSVASWFGNKFTEAWNSIKNAWSGVKSWFTGKWNEIKNVFNSVGTWFGNKFKEAWTNIKNQFSGWASFWSNLWTQVKNKFTGIGTSIGNAIGGAVKGAINKVIAGAERAINSGISLINSAIGLINKLPGVSIGRIGSVSFPRLAQGGVLKKGQVGLLEGSGAEAVVPLERNKQWIHAVAEDMKAELMAMKPTGNVSENINNSKTQNFTQIINAPKQPSRIELYRQTKNLLALAKEGL